MLTGPDGQTYPSSESLLARFNAIADSTQVRGSSSDGHDGMNDNEYQSAHLSFLKRTGREPTFGEMIGSVPEFINDVCGSRHVQKMFQFGSDDERSFIVMQVNGMMPNIMLNRYGKFVMMAILEHGSLQHKTVLAQAASSFMSKVVTHRDGYPLFITFLERLPQRQRTELVR
jgi:hypothetical protein